MRSIEWADGDIVIIDQTALPAELKRLRIRTTEHLAEAIAHMRVRGAPALGIAGAMGVAQRALTQGLESAERAGVMLKATRPTAVNLAWGVERTLDAGREAAGQATSRETAQRMLEEALQIQAEDEQA